VISRNYAAVVIPVHKPFTDLTAAEVLSLKSTCKCLREYPHVLIGPESINWNEYKASLHSYNVEDVSIKVFDKIFFTDIDGYSSLLKTFNFYKTFNGFKFILIFQLDAYILKNELDYWCSKGYDYIGAPWLDTTTEEIIGVGNGGFSLRKVDSAIRVTKRMIFLQRLRRFWFKSHFQAIISFPRVVSYFQKYLKIRNMEEVNIIHCASYPNEDHYWSILSNFFTDYNVANKDEAMYFSFETNPSILYKKTNYNLPFGCHAWQKYQPDFWKEHIDNSNCEE
jgi:hypothetical protein